MANEFKHGSVGTSLSQAEWEGIGTHVVESQATGDLIYASSSSQLRRLAIGSTNDVLRITGGVPDWQATTFITALGTIATGVWQGTDVGVAYGGTGVSTLTDGGILLGSGASAITAMAVLTDGQMIVGDGTTDPVAESGATLRTSIGVGTGDAVQFAGITGTTIDATTDFTIGSTIITDGVITDSSGLKFTANVHFGADGTDQDVTFYGDTSGRDMTWDAGSSGGSLIFDDNAVLKIGTGGDLSIYHDGSDSYINDGGTGNLIVASSLFQVMNAALDENMIYAAADGAVTLYYNSSGVFATTSTGAIIKGATPTLTIGDAGTEDTKIVFDGAAQDFHIGLDDTADDLVIGKGTTLGTTTAIAIDSVPNVTIGGAYLSSAVATLGINNTQTHSTTATVGQLIFQGTVTQSSTGRMGVIDIQTALTHDTGGTVPLAFGMRILAPTLTVSAGAVTDSASLYINNAMSNAGTNYALWVDAGASRFDEYIQIKSDAAGILHTNAGGTNIGLIGVRSDIGGTDALTIHTYSNKNTIFSGGRIVVGQAEALDTSIVFDGAAQDFYIGLEDAADDLVIGVGSTLGTTSAIEIDSGARIGIGTAPNANYKLTIGGAHTGGSNSFGIRVEPTITGVAGNNASILNVAGTLVEAGSGTHGYLWGSAFSAPTVTGGSASVTNTATVYVSGAMSAGTNNYALWVDAGVSRFDGGINVTGNSYFNNGDIYDVGTASAQWIANSMVIGGGTGQYLAGTDSASTSIFNIMPSNNGADNSVLALLGGHDWTAGSGAYVSLYGEDHASNGGDVFIVGANGTNKGTINFYTSGARQWYIHPTNGNLLGEGNSLYDVGNATSEWTDGNLVLAQSSNDSTSHFKLIGDGESASDVFAQISVQNLHHGTGTYGGEAYIQFLHAGQQHSDRDGVDIFFYVADTVGNLYHPLTLESPATEALTATRVVAWGKLAVGAANDNNAFSTLSVGSGSTTMYLGNATVTTSSDERLKTDIRPTQTNALDLVNKFNVVDFEWDDPTDSSAEYNKNYRGTYTGMVAQETVKVAPWIINDQGGGRDCDECVSGNECEEHGMWHVEYQHLVPTLVKAIQELSKELEEVRNG